jgi:hypothetical protein
VKLDSVSIAFLENLKVRVKATRRRSIFIDHTLGSHEGQSVEMVEMTIVTSMVSGCDGSGLISRVTVEGDNFEGDDWMLCDNNLAVVDLLDTEGEIAGLSGGDHLNCFLLCRGMT